MTLSDLANLVEIVGILAIVFGILFGLLDDFAQYGAAGGFVVDDQNRLHVTSTL